MEIKCQLDATDESLLQILLLAQHVSGTIMPIIRSSRVLYRWLLPVVFGAWFSSCRYGVELRVVCPVLHLVGILFPHIKDDARSKPHQIYTVLSLLAVSYKTVELDVWNCVEIDCKCVYSPSRKTRQGKWCVDLVNHTPLVVVRVVWKFLCFHLA